MSRSFYQIVTIGLTALLLCVTLVSAKAQDSTTQPEQPPIRIGSKEFSEQLLLGKMLVLLLQESGYPVEDLTATGGSTAVRSALEKGEIDLYPEYTGTALSVYHELPSDALPNSASRSYELAKSLDAALGLVWLEPAQINNTYTLMVRQELIDQGIVSLTDLAAYMNANNAPLTLCVESEFFGRPDGLLGLQTQYDFAFSEENILVMEASETYTNLREGACDVAEGYATDGRINAWGFTNLTDPLAFFPFYNPTPVIRQATLDAYPELPALINGLWQYLDNETMTDLNAQVDIGADGILSNGDEEKIEDVVHNFLVSKRLIKPDAIKIGSKEFNEQLLLGKMIVLLLQDAGFTVEDKTGLGGSPVVRAALQSGEIDIYPEYTGTATSLHHNLPVSALPADARRTYLLAKSLDTPQGLVWLDAAPLNNTFTLMVRQELIDQGVASLEDLAEYMNNNDSPLKICVEGEFFSRQDGLVGLQELYDFAFKDDNILVMEPNETYDNLRNGACEVAEGFATDGRINAWGFQNLQDPLAFFPFYQPAPVVREATLALYPEIADLLNELMQDLDDSTMSALNARVDIGTDGELASGDEESVEAVAYSYLREKRLIKLPAITVAAVDATESSQRVLGNMLTMFLADQGYQVVDKIDLGSGPLVRDAMQKGDVDVYMESVSNALAYSGLPATALPTDPKRAYQLIKSLDAAKGMNWAAPTSYSPAYVIMAQPSVLALGINNLEELAQYMNENEAPLTICMDNDFYSRTLDGIAGLEELYAFSFKPDNIFLIDAEDVYDAFGQGECDVAAGFNVDALVRQYTVLEDPLLFFPANFVAPVIRQETLVRNPELTDLIGALTQLITNDVMVELKAAIEIGADGLSDSGDELAVDVVVRNFLLANGLLSAEAAAEPPATAAENGEEGDTADELSPQVSPTLTDTSIITDTPLLTDTFAITDAVGVTPITVASMGYTEQAILGKLLVLTLQDRGYPVVDRTGVGSSPDLRTALERGEIDLYPEFPRTVLTLYHNIPENALPTDGEETYALAKSLDEAFNFAWLRKVSFDSAYALLIRQALADRGLTTIADLVTYVKAQSEPLQFCVEADFVERTDGDLTALLAQYDLTISTEDIATIAPDEIYAALRNAECDVAAALRTDGRIRAWQLVALEDSLGTLPSYVPAPVTRQAVVDQYPELEADLGQVSELLDEATMVALNARVDLGVDGEVGTGDEEPVATVATGFLCENGVLTACDAVTSAESEEVAPTTLVVSPTTVIPLPVPPVSIVTSIAPITTVALPTATAEVIEVTTPDSYGVNARATANIGAIVVTVLPRSTTVRAIGRTEDSSWLQLQLPDNQLVWVFTAAVLTNPETLLRLPVIAP